MKLGGLKFFLKLLYEDRFDVYRTSMKINDDGTQESVRDDEPVISDEPCLLSLKQGIDYAVGDPDHSASRDVGVNSVDLSPRIFCSPDILLKAGDYVCVKRMKDDGTTYECLWGYIGKPSWFSNHQTCELNIRKVG